MKNLLPVLLAVFVSGCSTTFTNLTPLHQVRNENNLYPVEVSLNTRQQSLRWDSIKPYAVVGGQFIEMRPTPLMTNRWETLIPVPAGANLTHYRYKFDFKYNAPGGPREDSALSPTYTLQVVNPQP